MKYRNKQLTYMQRNFRKFHSWGQSMAAIAGVRLKKKKPRWRQLRKARKARKKHETQ